MAVLAALASLLFPGTGQAFTGRVRPTVAWAIAGLLPVLGGLVWPPAIWLAVAVRIGSAIHAWWVATREPPGTQHLSTAGISAVAQGAVLAMLQVVALEAFAPRSTSMAPTLDLGDHVLVDKLTPRIAGYARGDVVVFDHPSGVKFLKRIVAVGGDAVAVRRGVVYVNGTAAPLRPLGPTTYWEQLDERGEEWREVEVTAAEETLGGHVYRVFHARAGDDPSGAAWDHDFPDARAAGPGRDPCADAILPRNPSLRVTYAQPALARTADGTACTVPPGTYFLLGDNRDNSNDSRSWGVIPAERMVGRVIGVWWSRSPRTGTDLSRLGRID